MKFVCSNCKAKYQIADEKILGRTLKMDCRRCNASITIRGDLPQQADEMDLDEGDARPASVRPPAASARRVPGAAAGGSSVGAHPASASVASRPRAGLGAQASAPSALGSSALGSSALGSSALGADFRRGASMAPEARPQENRTSVLDQWHVAINDVPVGPMRREEVSRKIATGAITPDSLAWREGFDDWRPVRDVPELAALLRKAEPVRPQPAARPQPTTSASARLAAASPSRLGARPAAAAAAPAGAQARGGNVVPIGGRLGGAAPAFDEEQGLDEGQDEPTQIASAADLGLLAFGDANALRDPAAPKVDAKAKAPQKPENKAPAPIPAPRKDPTGPIPAPRKDPTGPSVGPSKVAAPVAPPKAKEPSVKTPLMAPEDDGLPPLLDAPAPKNEPFAAPLAGPAFAPAPAAASAPLAAPVPAPVAPVAAPVAKEPERRRGVPWFAWMGMAGAVAFGGVFALLAAQRFLPATAAPTAVATVTPAPETPPAAPEVVPDVEVPTPPETPPVAEVAPTAPETPTAEAEAPTAEGGSRPRTGGTRPSTTGTPASTGGSTERPPAELSGALARMAAESGGPATIGGAATRRDLTDGASAAGTGELTAEQIAHVVTRERTGLQRCWETAIRGMRETPTVRMDVDLTIGSSGTVTAAAARGPTVGSLSECIERGVRRWRFPASGGTSRTSFPVVFSGTN